MSWKLVLNAQTVEEKVVASKEIVIGMIETLLVMRTVNMDKISIIHFQIIDNVMYSYSSLEPSRDSGL